MPHIPPLPPDEAPKEVQDLYEDFRRKMSFPAPPNFIKTQGHSLAAARAAGISSATCSSGASSRDG
jgi:hypothetical protein